MKFLIIFIMLAMPISSVFADTTSTTKEMGFDDCIKVIEKTVKQLGVPYNTIVNTKILRMVKIITADGSILLTCSKPDRKMTTTITQQKLILKISIYELSDIMKQCGSKLVQFGAPTFGMRNKSSHRN